MSSGPKLKKYSAKRDLKKSPEPKPKVIKRKKGKLHFVIQKHAATRLHYDLRLEVDGVLKSWAVPKGPSLDPSVKRLAVMVEDHPYAYKNFEGIIPEGYGRGTVMIWDQGTYNVHGESDKESEALMREGLKKGVIDIFIEGEKLHGNYSLIKLKKDGDEWLLIKKKDSFASEEDVTDQDASVVSGRTLEEIAEDHGFVQKVKKKDKKKPKPHHIKPMLATLVDQPFDDENWIFEIKWDGYRALAELDESHVEIYSRNLLSFNKRFPEIVHALKKMGMDAVLDGEIVALDSKGVSHFQVLQNNLPGAEIYFYVFDILYLDGNDLRGLPLIQRKAILKSHLKNQPHVRYLDHVEEKGKLFFQACKRQGCEGIIAKKKEGVYETGVRSKSWLKIKATLRQEVVICGFTAPRKGRKNFGSLIVGVYKNNVLHYAGHVGGGFTDQKLKEVKDLLMPLVIEKSPFKNPPRTNTAVTWVKPKYLCEVKFSEWTEEKIMRQPIFLGLRADKPAKSVVREVPEPTKKYAK